MNNLLFLGIKNSHFFLFVYNKMKGDGNIKVNIKFIGLGYYSKYQANVKIYSDNCLIYDCDTYNGQISIDLTPHNIYRIESNFFNEKIIRYILVNRCEYIFVFNHAIYNRNTITFLLRDYYYNLPIEKGEIILWKRQ